MMFPFMTLDDETEITHSELLSDGTVKVYLEKPDEEDCFHYATCYLQIIVGRMLSSFQKRRWGATGK